MSNLNWVSEVIFSSFWLKGMKPLSPILLQLRKVSDKLRLCQKILVKIEVKVFENFEILKCGGNTSQAFISQFMTTKGLDFYF